MFLISNCTLNITRHMVVSSVDNIFVHCSGFLHVSMTTVLMQNITDMNQSFFIRRGVKYKTRFSKAKCFRLQVKDKLTV